MSDGASLATVVDTIRVAVAPVFLLSGIGVMLSVLTGRLARVVDRARAFNGLSKEVISADSNLTAELDLLPKRISLINRAILLSVASALAVSLVIALLFVSRLADLNIGITVAVTFIASMLLLMAGVVCFLIEVRLSLRLIYIACDLSKGRGSSGEVGAVPG
jgi:Protein of unknown function (DUF2721)